MNCRQFEMTRRWMISMALALVVAVGFGSDPAAAAEIDVDGPATVEVGEMAVVVCTVSLDGEPVANAELALSFLGHMGGESGWVVVATATTDAAGQATMQYEQRALDGGRMRVAYFGPDGQENAEFTVTVIDGPQQVRSDAGADLPLLGVGWIIVVLGIVWVLMVLAARGLLQIGGSSEGDDEDAPMPVRWVPRLAVGFIVFTAAGMLVVLVTKPQSHANLDPTAPFGRMPQAVIGVDYDYTGLDDSSRTPERGELSAHELYVQVGCASCHAPGGRGGIVGPAISGDDRPSSFDDFIDEIRDGPQGMPAYSDRALSDEEAAELYDYLEVTAGQD